MALRFFYNGIKGTDNKLQKCWYSDGAYINYPAGTLTIYAREYEHFSQEVRAAFTVQNDTDTQTDYFEKDRIRVMADHPLYASVVEALRKCKARGEKRAERWTSQQA